MGKIRFAFVCSCIVAVIIVSSPYTKADDVGEDVNSLCNDPETTCKQGLVCGMVGTAGLLKTCQHLFPGYWDASQIEYIAKKEDGDDCVEECDEGPPCFTCKDKCKSGVSRNNRCECQDETKYFDTDTKTCTARLRKGDTCTTVYECGDNQKCSRITKKCVCLPSMAYDGDNNNCVPLVTVNGEANAASKCKPTLILKDVNRTKVCRCQDNQAWIPVLDKCVDRFNPGAPCIPRFTACKFGICRGRCPCEDGKHLDGTECKHNKKPGEECKKNFECVSGAKCRKNRCICTEGKYADHAGKCSEMPFKDICGPNSQILNLTCGQKLKDACGTIGFAIKMPVTNVTISLETPLGENLFEVLVTIGTDTLELNLHDPYAVVPEIGMMTPEFVVTLDYTDTKGKKSVPVAYSCEDKVTRDVELLVTNVKTTRTTINPRAKLGDIITAVSSDIQMEIKTNGDDLVKTTVDAPRHVCIYIRPGPMPRTQCIAEDANTHPKSRSFKDRTLGCAFFTEPIPARTSKKINLVDFIAHSMGLEMCRDEAHLIIQYDSEFNDKDLNRCNNIVYVPVTLDCGEEDPETPKTEFLGLPGGLSAFATFGPNVYSFDFEKSTFTKIDLSSDALLDRGLAVYKNALSFYQRVLNDADSRMCIVAMKRIKSSSDHRLLFENKDIDDAVRQVGKDGYMTSNLTDLKGKIKTAEDAGAFKALVMMNMPRKTASVLGDTSQSTARLFLQRMIPFLSNFKTLAALGRTKTNIYERVVEWLAMQKTFLIALLESEASVSMNLDPVVTLIEELGEAIKPSSTSVILSPKCKTKIDLVLAMIQLTLKHDVEMPLVEEMDICELMAWPLFVDIYDGWGQDIPALPHTSDDKCGSITWYDTFGNNLPILYKEIDDKMFAWTLDLLNNRLVGKQIAVMDCPYSVHWD